MPKPGMAQIDEGKLYDTLLARVRKVLEWSWDDIDAEPTRDMRRLQDAVDDIDDLQRIKKVT